MARRRVNYSQFFGVSLDKPTESGQGILNELKGLTPLLPADDAAGGLTGTPGYSLAGQGTYAFVPSIHKEQAGVEDPDDGTASTSVATSFMDGRVRLGHASHPELNGDIVFTVYSGNSKGTDGEGTGGTDELGRFLSLAIENWGGRIPVGEEFIPVEDPDDDDFYDPNANDKFPGAQGEGLKFTLSQVTTHSNSEYATFYARYSGSVLPLGQQYPTAYSFQMYIKINSLGFQPDPSPSTSHYPMANVIFAWDGRQFDAFAYGLFIAPDGKMRLYGWPTPSSGAVTYRGAFDDVPLKTGYWYCLTIIVRNGNSTPEIEVFVNSDSAGVVSLSGVPALGAGVVSEGAWFLNPTIGDMTYTIAGLRFVGSELSPGRPDLPFTVVNATDSVWNLQDWSIGTKTLDGPQSHLSGDHPQTNHWFDDANGRADLIYVTDDTYQTVYEVIDISDEGGG